MAKPQVNSLQVFRGFAAIAVVAHHAELSTTAFVGEIPAPLATWLGMGFLGVDFFFVLSGFIIMYAHMDDDHSFQALKRYAFKRTARIYPAYLPVGIGLMVMYAILPGVSAAGGGRDYSLLSSLLLLPANGPPALSVAWTLVHELMFYGIFLLFFRSVKWLAVGLFAWAIIIALSNYFWTPSGWLRYPLSLLNIEFMLGVGAAWLVGTGKIRSHPGWFALFGGTLAFIVLCVMTVNAAAYLHLLFAAGLAFSIMGFAVREQSVAMGWWPLLLILGNASYSIYLIHNPLLSMTQRLASQASLTWPAAMLFGVLLSLLAGWAYYLMVERPALQFFKRRLRTE